MDEEGTMERPTRGHDDHTLFEEELVSRLHTTDEVDIETVNARRQPRETTIWVVTDGKDVFIRSVRGAAGVWYREIVTRPDAALRVGGDRIPVRAVPIASGGWDAVSQLFRDKYGRREPASTESMVQPDTLPTTLRLEPR